MERIILILIGFFLSITDALCVHSAIWGSSFGPCDSSIRPGGPIWDLLPSSFASSWMKQGSAASVRSSRGLRPWSGGWSLSKRRCRTRSARLGMKAEGSVLLCRTNHESEPRPLPGTQMANHICSVRKKCLTGWKQGHTPEMRFGTPAFGGGFLLRLECRAWGLFTASFWCSQRGRPPFPVERRPSSLVCALQSTCSVKLYP